MISGFKSSASEGGEWHWSCRSWIRRTEYANVELYWHPILLLDFVDIHTYQTCLSESRLSLLR